jgi:hypothetical protein
MNLPIYMDVNVPGPVTRELRRRGIDVLTAQEDGRRTHSDPSLLDRAAELDRLFITCDSDFLAEAANRQRHNREFAGIIYAHPLSLTIGQFVENLELICQASQAKDWRNQATRLPL